MPRCSAKILPLAGFLLFTAPQAALANSSVLPVDLLPAPLTLPEPWFVLKPLLLLTFFIHIILVNILIGSTIFAAVNAFRPHSSPTAELVRDTSFIPKILALAVNFGVAPYLFLQVIYSGYLYTSTVLMAVWWLSIIGFAMLAYYALYIAGSGAPRGDTCRRVFLVATVCMLLFIAFVLSNNSTLMLQPDRWLRWADNPGGTLLNLGDPTAIPRYLHFVFASVAAGGLVLAWRGHLNRNKPRPNASEQDVAAANARVKEGLSWYMAATLCQAAVGVWFFFSLPAEIRALFLGGQQLATAALLLALAGLVLAFIFALAGRVLYTSAAVGGIILIMICIRDIVRDAYLLPYVKATSENPLPLPIFSGQHAALVLFLVCAVGAVFAVAWMIRTFFRAYCRARALEGEE